MAPLAKPKTRLVDLFVPDQPVPGAPAIERVNLIENPIAGCIAVRLAGHADSRGELVELLTTRDGPIEEIAHVYQVFAAPGSLRGWVYHARQSDRLAYTNGRLRVVLHDIREESPTFGVMNELIVGEANPVLLTIPPLVAHAVENIGESTASFVNLPTRAWLPEAPDKFRLPVSAGVLPDPRSPRR